MGVSLSYSSDAVVSDAVRSKIMNEARQLIPTRDWWCESIVFFEDPRQPGRLLGDTKLFLIGYSTPTLDEGYIEVDPDEDTLMAYYESRFIIDHLCKWSVQNNLSWTLEMEGAEVGRINNGRFDGQLFEMLTELAEVAGLDLNVQDIEGQAKRIRDKYATRNDE